MKDIAEDITTLRTAAEKRYSKRHVSILKKVVGKIIPLLVLVLIITIFIRFSINLTPGQERILILLDRGVIGLFAIDLLTDYILSSSKSAFLKKRWFSFILFLPLFSIIGKLGTGTARLLYCSEILSKGEKAECLLRFLESNTLNPAMKASHVTNISARLARSSFILERLRSI